VVSGGSDDLAVDAEDITPEQALAFEASEPTVSFGEPPRPLVLGDHLPHESPPVMTVPLLIMGVLSIVGGVLAIPLKGVEFLTTWLEPVFRDAATIKTPSFAEGLLLSGISVVLGLVGIGIAISLYRRGIPSPERDPAVERLGVLGRLFGHAYYYDEGVSRFVAGPGRRLAEWISSIFDRRIVDGAVNGIASLVRGTAGGIRRVQTGLVRSYALWIAVGAAGLLLYLVIWAGR
jgi:NADH-quinone oxidoreductase subunit L